MLTRGVRERGIRAPGAGRTRAYRTLPLRRTYLDDARSLAATCPVRSVHVASALDARGVLGRSLRHLWLVEEGGEAVAVVQHRRGFSFAASPRGGSPRQLAAPLGRLVAREVRGCEVLFGEEPMVRAVLRDAVSLGVHVSDVRAQELLEAGSLVRPPGPAPVRGFTLRPARRGDLPWLLEAHAAMCREDLGIDQVSRNRAGYDEYFTALVAGGRSLVGEVDGRPVFKAEYAVESRRARLIEGVYTCPSVRRRGLAEWAMRWIAATAKGDGRSACLYVHEENGAARRVYRRAGYRRVCPWATALVSESARRASYSDH